ncbi:MAG: universal stress protein [Alphaproteobacteria bacterium]|nr:universal stress protein [Alphaproteobacteria bacterium]
MTIQVIFAPVTGRKSDSSVLAAARGAAKRFNAHIDVVSLRADPRDAIPYLGEGISGALVEEFIAQAETENTEQAHKARAAFNEWRDAAGFVLADSMSDAVAIQGSTAEIPTCSWREVTGASDQTAASYGRLADLIVAPRGELANAVENEVAFETALLYSGRPLLLAPPTPQEEFGNRIAIAWDGSAEASRAVGAALPFLCTAEEVTAITVAEDNKVESPVEDLARYLSWHGVTANTRNVGLESRTVGEAILGAARHESADLLVMGAYSHNRFRQLVFGGATRYILDEGAMPVLMTH